jgi:hypothetical protein
VTTSCSARAAGGERRWRSSDAFDLQVAELQVRKYRTVTGGLATSRNVVLANPSAQPLFAAKPMKDMPEEHPFDLVVLYPAVPAAKLLSLPARPKVPLPDELAPARLIAAIDLDGDGAAEALLANTPKCAVPAPSPGFPPCTETWLVRNGAWARWKRSSKSAAERSRQPRSLSRQKTRLPGSARGSARRRDGQAESGRVYSTS